MNNNSRPAPLRSGRLVWKSDSDKVGTSHDQYLP